MNRSGEIKGIKTNNPKNISLKVVAFKLLNTQVDSLRQLCIDGLYSSVSEAIRIAILDYLTYIAEITNDNENEYWVDSTLIDKFSSRKVSKQSACAKMPSKLLELINQTIKINNGFINRTNFIRIAVDRFLNNDNQIYSPWLSLTRIKQESNQANQSLNLN